MFKLDVLVEGAFGAIRFVTLALEWTLVVPRYLVGSPSMPFPHIIVHIRMTHVVLAS